MPGRRGKNLRSGDLAEELGVLLLKGIAAVAEVPRPEDIGFDGVATLLREDGSGFLYAEDSFYVQLKSASVGSVAYEGYEAKWLMNLKLPLFIGSVNSKDSTISLYTTFRLSFMAALEYSNYTKLSLHMQKTEEKSDPKGERSLNIGPPLLKWGFEDLQSAEFRKKAYEMLKTVIGAEERNIKYRTIRYVESINWETNERVGVGGRMMTSRGNVASDMVQLLEAMEPYIRALSTQFIDTSGKDELDVKAFVEFVEFMQRYNIYISTIIN
ncbi:MAG: hypothetical protein WBX00_11650 [Isosphaeraceae bacterium]